MERILRQHLAVGKYTADVKTDEGVWSLEGSRRLGETWTLYVEARVFGGADELPEGGFLPDPGAGAGRSSALQQDDYVQVELTRYF